MAPQRVGRPRFRAGTGKAALQNLGFEKAFSKSIDFGEQRCQDVLFRVVSEIDFC
jgi:hypothetical protein